MRGAALSLRRKDARPGESVFHNRIESGRGKSTIQGTKNRHRLFFCGRGIPSVPWKKAEFHPVFRGVRALCPGETLPLRKNVYPERAQSARRVRSLPAGMLTKEAGRNAGSSCLPDLLFFTNPDGGHGDDVRISPGRARRQLRGTFCRSFPAEGAGSAALLSPGSAPPVFSVLRPGGEQGAAWGRGYFTKNTRPGFLSCALGISPSG